VQHHSTNQKLFLIFKTFMTPDCTLGRLIIYAILILLVTYFVKLYALNFGKIGFWEFYVVTNFRKQIRPFTGGPLWTQIKVVLIQGLLDNQNPSFCMGWPGLYLLDNIDQLGSLCAGTLQRICMETKLRIKIDIIWH
jgi:hypothetical protein